MSEVYPVVYVARHGETAWSLPGQHSGRNDLPLTPRGERNAKRLGERLIGISFSKVFTSPLRRAFWTCAPAAFDAVAESDHDLVEWNYGEYEGRPSAQIHTESPNWDLFSDGYPGGESSSQVGEQPDRVMFPSIPGENVESEN